MAAAAPPLNVHVVNYPLKYFAERIGGDHVRVHFPVPADIDPAYWLPRIKDIANYQQADLILLNGAGYAKWTRKVTLPRSKMVDTSKAFKDRYIVMEEAVTHSHGAEGEHAHESTAFTVWLDFELAAGQARAVAKAFIRKRPDLKATFSANLAGLEKDLSGLDGELKRLVSNNPSRPLLGSHPVYHYLARRYGLNMRSVHWEPGEVPDDRQMMELHGLLKDHPAQWMVWEGAPVAASADRLETIGIHSLVFDPCANTPASGDFLSIMRQNIDNLKAAYR